MLKSPNVTRSIAVVGLESAGKSTLVSGLSGQSALASNFRGTTVACERYRCRDGELIDTPGLLFASDSEALPEVLELLADSDAVLLVVRATHLDEELDRLLPLVGGRRGVVVLTFWDKVQPGEHAWEAVEQLSRTVGVPFVPVDARELSSATQERIFAALEMGGKFRPPLVRPRVGWKIEPRASLFEIGALGSLLSLMLLLLPMFCAVQLANTLAGWADPLVASLVGPAAEWLQRTMPTGLAAVLAGRYGLLTMGPLLFLWAAPTVVIYALLGVYKTSGLIDRLTVGIQPWMRPFGLTGRDLVRILMGMGCNVPAVINSRSCSSCTRTTCLHAIGFGSACSYQFGATLGVFAAADRPWLIWPYVGYLAFTTLLYSRWVSPAAARDRTNLMLLEGRSFLQWPTGRALRRETASVLREFFGRALPIFLGITIAASLLDLAGVLQLGAQAISPALGLLNLPGDAALPVMLSCIRKDGLLLFAEAGFAAQLSSWQLLTGVYFAGVLMPCLVTVLTIARERSWMFAGRLLARQIAAACVFSLLLAAVGQVWS
ncbi:MAG: GTPase [Planctomycetaceae bacterium]|nr:GTPase [Planctomycetaceae bacterium]